jgi:hypothetical protein
MLCIPCLRLATEQHCTLPQKGLNGKVHLSAQVSLPFPLLLVLALVIRCLFGVRCAHLCVLQGRVKAEVG